MGLRALVPALALSIGVLVAGEGTFVPDPSVFRNHGLAAPDHRQCAAACNRESRCASYTYVSPNVRGPLAQCLLRDRVPPRLRR